ncbi:MAG: DNA polymerase III subunit delta' [Aeromonas sp.]
MYPWLMPAWQTLQQAFNLQQMAHAWLFYGQAGVGVEQLAERVAARFLCTQPNAQGACGQCHSCQLVAKGHHPDFSRLATQGKSIGVDAIRTICQKFEQSAQLGHGKVVIIQGAQHMTTAAANALLKTLEEPSHASLLLLTGEQLAGFLPTILSRCQKLLCQVPKEAQTLAWLSEQGISATLTHLRICHGAPLRVRDYLGAGQDHLRRDLLTQLSQLHIHSAPLNLLAQQLQQESELKLLWLQLLLTDAVKLQAHCQHAQLAMPDVHNVTSHVAEHFSCEHLLSLIDDLLKLRALSQPGQLTNLHIHFVNWLNRWL